MKKELLFILSNFVFGKTKYSIFTGVSLNLNSLLKIVNFSLEHPSCSTFKLRKFSEKGTEGAEL